MRTPALILGPLGLMIATAFAWGLTGLITLSGNPQNINWVYLGFLTLASLVLLLHKAWGWWQLRNIGPQMRAAQKRWKEAHSR